MLLRTMLTAVALTWLTVSSSAVSADVGTAAITGSKDIPDVFLEMLKAGKTEQAVEFVMSAPAWKSRPDLRTQMAGQLSLALPNYGQMVTFEKVRTDTIGTLFRREQYLVQHELTVVRWDFFMVRLSSGWLVAHFGFSDEPKEWLSEKPIKPEK